MNEYTGWLLDLYAHPSEGVVLWLLGQDGKRTSFHQDFPITFYAGGPFPRLRELWRFLASKPAELSRTRREDLYAGPQEVMEIRVASPGLYPDLFREVSKRFPDLTFYDADLALPLRYAVAFNVFPMARCRVVLGPDGNVLSLSVDDTPWALDPERFDGAILFFEDLNTPTINVWNDLQVLRNNGVFDRIAGLLVGPVETVQVLDEAPQSLREVVLEVLGERDIPVIGNVNLGHAGPNIPLPLGIRAAIDADARTIELVEAAVG